MVADQACLQAKRGADARTVEPRVSSRNSGGEHRENIQDCQGHLGAKQDGTTVLNFNNQGVF